MGGFRAAGEVYLHLVSWPGEGGAPLQPGGRREDGKITREKRERQKGLRE